MYYKVILLDINIFQITCLLDMAKAKVPTVYLKPEPK